MSLDAKHGRLRLLLIVGTAFLLSSLVFDMFHVFGNFADQHRRLMLLLTMGRTLMLSSKG